MGLNILQLDTQSSDYSNKLSQRLAWEGVSDDQIQDRVKAIIERVRNQGDDALLAYTQEFDHHPATDISQLELSQQELNEALESLDAKTREALVEAANRVESYHKNQIQKSWQYQEDNGNILGQKITPMDRVGIYVPGGKAAYPSSVIMNAMPAKVAGVKEIIMVVPTPKGEHNQLVLAAAALAGVSRVFSVGGAQAVAALAYGTQSVPQVDKIVGPGNIYVATAKREVFGQVGIDMIAGPSEILVVCDGRTDPDWIAMDLFSQAEHDEQAQSILISEDKDFLDAVKSSMDKLLPTMERAEIIKTSLENRGVFIHTHNKSDSLETINRIAPEHLELSVAEPETWLDGIRHAGAIFMGRYTAEALGDYCAGPNHVLPTSGTARFSSPLGVYDFQKRSSIIHCSQQGASQLGEVASILARGEYLTAHAQSAEFRIKK